MNRTSFWANKVGLCVVVAALTSAAGCQWWGHREAPPLAPPVAQQKVTHFAGTPLSGPRPVRATQGAAWAVSATATFVESLPADAFAPVGPTARLVIGPDAGSPLTPSSRMVYTTKLRPLGMDESLELGDAKRVATLDSLRGAVVVGSTVGFSITLPDTASRRAITLEVARRAEGDAYELAIAGDDPAASRTQRELILIDRAIADGADHLAIAMPIRLTDSKVSGVVIDLRVETAASSSDNLVETMNAEIDRSVAAVAQTLSTQASSSQDLAMLGALQAIGTPGTDGRATMAFLARNAGAPLTDAVLGVADDRVVELIAAQVQQRLPQLTVRDRANVAWMLDRSTISALASIKEDEATQLLPPIQGALSIYAGEAGRKIDVLGSIANESAGSDDLFSRIIAEHFILLEESSPALRVRAYDWLNAHGKAPACYDPLGTMKDRRAALEAARNAADSTTQPVN